jgi:glycerophosphoryl diester phosphodiesterase
LPLLLLYDRASRESFSPENLRELKKLVQGVGPSKLLVDQFPELIKNSHDAGLSVTIYTCRSKQTGKFADVKSEMKHYLNLGVDAIFTDNPDQFSR